MVYREVFKLVGGSVAVYVIVAACASDASLSGGGDGQGTDESHGGGASGGSLATGSEGMSGGAGMMDSIVDPVPDAMAQDECDCTARTITADSDPERAVQGSVSLSDGNVEKIAEGPLFVTHAQGNDAANTGSIVLAVVPGDECTDDESFEYHVAFGYTGAAVMQNAVHFLVPAGSALCASTYDEYSSAVLRWSGFRPYGT